MNPLRAAVGAVDLLAPKGAPPTPRYVTQFAPGMFGDERITEEAMERVHGMQRFEKAAFPVGWIIGGAAVATAWIFLRPQVR